MGRPKKEQVPPGNPRFIEWIQQWLDEAKGKEHLTNMRFCYQRVGRCEGS